MRETPRRVMTVDEAATVLRMTPRAVTNACRRGDIKALKIGREWRIASSVIDELLGMN